MGYECFALYGLAVSYPDMWDVAVGRKLDRFDGGVMFRSPENDILISLTWSLPDVQEEGETASPSLKEGVERTIKEISRARGVKAVDVLEEKKIEVNEHEGLFTSLKVAVATGALLRGPPADKRSLLAHVYCDKTERYIVLYGVPTEKSKDQATVFSHMLKSIVCHQNQPSQ